MRLVIAMALDMARLPKVKIPARRRLQQVQGRVRPPPVATTRLRRDSAMGRIMRVASCVRSRPAQPSAERRCATAQDGSPGCVVVSSKRRSGLRPFRITAGRVPTPGGGVTDVASGAGFIRRPQPATRSQRSDRARRRWPGWLIIRCNSAPLPGRRDAAFPRRSVGPSHQIVSLG
jgi:hypothetical protein